MFAMCIRRACVVEASSTVLCKVESLALCRKESTLHRRKVEEIHRCLYALEELA